MCVGEGVETLDEKLAQAGAGQVEVTKLDPGTYGSASAPDVRPKSGITRSAMTRFGSAPRHRRRIHRCDVAHRVRGASRNAAQLLVIEARSAVNFSLLTIYRPPQAGGLRTHTAVIIQHWVQ